MDTKAAHVLGRYILVAALVVVLLPRLFVLVHPAEGRYQITGVGTNSVVIDSATGRMWTRFVPTNADSEHWVEIEPTPTSRAGK